MMASRGYRYEGSDKITEYLLNQVAKYTRFDHLGTLSRDLRIREIDYVDITASSLTPLEQKFKVHTFNYTLVIEQRIPVRYCFVDDNRNKLEISCKIFHYRPPLHSKLIMRK